MPTYSSPIALTRDNGFVWVVNPNVEAVDPPQNDSVTGREVGNYVNTKVAEVTAGDDPQCVAVTLDNKKAYVTNMGSGTASVIDATTYQPSTTVRVGTEPFGCALTPDGKKLYVANFASDDVTVMRTSDDKVITTIKAVGVKLRGLAVTADGKTVYVTRFLAQLRAGKTSADDGQDDSKEGRVTVIDADKNRVAGTVTLQPIQVANFFLARGDTLNRIIFDPNAFNEIIAGIANAGQANVNGAKGVLGFNIPSLVSVFASAPYLHSGACPDLECVLENVTHRAAGTSGVDTLHAPGQRKKLVKFLKSIDLATPPLPASICRYRNGKTSIGRRRLCQLGNYGSVRFAVSNQTHGQHEFLIEWMSMRLSAGIVGKRLRDLHRNQKDAVLDLSAESY
jgi:YVTN family beta-propeller protein